MLVTVLAPTETRRRTMMNCECLRWLQEADDADDSADADRDTVMNDDEAAGSDVQSSDSAASVKQPSDHAAASSDNDEEYKCADDDDDGDDDGDDPSNADKETDAQDAVDQ